MTTVTADRLWVADASLLGAAFFEETETAPARSFLAREARLIAPTFLLLEIASIAAKKVCKDQTSAEVGARAVSETPRLVTLIDLSAPLALEAFRLAQAHRYSVYDAAYLALAMERQIPLVTLDAKLVARAQANGHALHMRLLSALGDG